MFQDKSVENVIKTYDQFIRIINDEVLKLNSYEKNNLRMLSSNG